MSSIPDGFEELFNELDGPFKISDDPTKVGGSLMLRLSPYIMDDVGLSVEGPHPELDMFYFDERRKLVIDLEGVEDE